MKSPSGQSFLILKILLADNRHLFQSFNLKLQRNIVSFSAIVKAIKNLVSYKYKRTPNHKLKYIFIILRQRRRE